MIELLCTGYNKKATFIHYYFRNAVLVKENNSLLKENNSLNKQIQNLQVQLNNKSKEQFGNFSYAELTSLFSKKIFELEDFENKNSKKVKRNALDVFYSLFNIFSTGVSNRKTDSEASIYIFYNIAPYYLSFDLLEIKKLPNSTVQRIQTTKLGNSFYSMMELKIQQNTK